MALGANLRAGAGISRKQFRPAMLPKLRMACEQPNQVIDFGNVGFSEAENQMRSLVFQPEGGETEP